MRTPISFLLFGLFLFLAVFLAPLKADDDASAYPGVKGSDQEIAHRLTGTWVGKLKGFRGTLVYRADGTCSSRLEPVDFPVVLFADPYSFEGTWKVDKGVLYSTVTKASTPKIPKGKLYKNILLELTPKLFVTKNELGWITPFDRGED